MKDLDIVIYIVPNSYFHVLTPYINSINILKNKNYKVVLFSKNINMGLISKSFLSGIDYYNIGEIRYFRKNIKILKWLIVLYNAIILLLELEFIKYLVQKRIQHKRNQIIIATDPRSLYVAGRLRKKTSFVYFPQELYHSKDVKVLEHVLLKQIERKYQKHAIACVSFDKIRATLLMCDNLSENCESIIIPNSRSGDSSTIKSTYFRDKFRIDNSKKIILYTGGVSNYNLTYETIRSTIHWPEEAVLVLHLFADESLMSNIKEEVVKTGRRIYISNKVIDFESIDILYASADIGLALYGDSTVNHKFAGHSSGKMFNFIFNCVPVITNSTDLLLNSIHANNCGVCINGTHEISSAIKIILSNENKYISGCKESYRQFEYSNHHMKLENTIVNYFNMKKKANYA